MNLNSTLADPAFYDPVAPPSSVSSVLPQPTGLYITRDPNYANSSASDNLEAHKTFTLVKPWLMIPNTFVTINPQNWSQNVFLLENFLNLSSGLPCSEPDCSNEVACKSLHDCLFSWLPGRGSFVDINHDEDRGIMLDTCLYRKFPQSIPPLRCGLLLIPDNIPLKRPCPRDPCDVANNVGPEIWKIRNIDQNLQTFSSGGLDTCGVYWPGQAAGESFAQALGGSLTRTAFDCSLERPCEYEFDCNDIGSHTAKMLGEQVLGVEWGLAALSSLENINQQLSNQYTAIKGALGLLALDTFSIGDFFPSPDGRFNVVNALTGLGTILSVVSGFVPGIGPGLAATGAILPAVGTFLGNAAASNGDPEVGQKEFAPKVRQLYTSYVDELDKAGADLFKGGSIKTANGDFNITDMMQNGAWANVSALTQLTALETNLTTEILSRSINALWQTFPHNKMWILVVDLDDDTGRSKCLADSSGPSDSKYCDDGGVYYAYNFVENGDDRGYVDHPWGGQLLQSKFGINLTVSNCQKS